MHGYLLQDWTTIAGNGVGTVTVNQDDDQWLDLGDYRDLQIWLDVSDLDPTGTVTIAVQTAALRDEHYFSNIETFTVTAAGLTVTSDMADYLCGHGQMPLARWLRWTATTPNTASVTFRIFVAAGGVGSGQVPDRLRSRLVEEWSS